jgi:hypothetical protein
LAGVVLAAVSIGCTTVATQPSDRFRVQQSGYADEESDASLFPSDAEVLSDDQIRRILETRVTVPPGARIALLHLNHRSLGRYFSWANYYGGTAAERLADEALVRNLRDSPSVTDAAYLPSLLLPPKRTVARLREAAARFQSDLLFVYATDCQVFSRYRVFAADESKAQCTAEAALLDVRTGVVPFTAKAAEEFLVKQQKSDIDFAETIERAETSASQAAVRSTAHSLIEFLDASRR